MHLDTERAANVFGQHAYLMRFKAEVPGKNVLRHVRRLGALIHRQALLAGIPVSDNGARLVGHAGMAAEHKGRFHHRIAVSECFIRISGDQRALEGQVVSEVGMNDRRGAIERGFRVGYRAQRLVLDVN